MAQSKARKSQRRSPREGSVYERPDRPGSWRGAIAWTDPDGKRRRVVVTGATSEEARDKLNRERDRLRLGVKTGDSGTTGDYLAGWIERHRARVRPSTWRTAEGYVRGYLIPALGRIPLSRLSAADVERALSTFVRSGRPTTAQDARKPRPVSPVTASHVRAVLRRALTDARKAGLVGSNVAADATPPRIPSQPIAYLAPDELARFLSATADDALAPLWALAASTGLRRGELVGLRWSDLDLQKGTLRVARAVSRDDSGGWAPSETKSARSRRTLPLPAMARNALDRQRKRQAAARLATGTAWQDRDGYVFTDAVGRPLLPEYVSHAFGKARTRAGLPAATLHKLRHTAATLLLAEGVPLAVISEWLGHSGIAVTAAHYAAVVPELRNQARDAMDRALSGGAS